VMGISVDTSDEIMQLMIKRLVEQMGYRESETQLEESNKWLVLY
jgi:hypothetical protein